MTMCSTGDLEGLRKIIVKVDVNCSHYDKRTPLHLAAAEGHLEVVELLITHGAQFGRDRWGNTPLAEVADKAGANYEGIRASLGRWHDAGAKIAAAIRTHQKTLKGGGGGSSPALPVIAANHRPAPSRPGNAPAAKGSPRSRAARASVAHT